MSEKDRVNFLAERIVDHDIIEMPEINLESSPLKNHKLKSLLEDLRDRKILVPAEKSEEAVKIEALTSAIKASNPAFMVSLWNVKGFGRFYLNELVLRQYVFDDAVAKWFKVDSEPNESLVEFLESVKNSLPVEP